jgi:hypothetical protein
VSGFNGSIRPKSLAQFLRALCVRGNDRFWRRISLIRKSSVLCCFGGRVRGLWVRVASKQRDETCFRCSNEDVSGCRLAQRGPRGGADAAHSGGAPSLTHRPAPIDPKPPRLGMNFFRTKLLWTTLTVLNRRSKAMNHSNHAIKSTWQGRESQLRQSCNHPWHESVSFGNLLNADWVRRFVLAISPRRLHSMLPSLRGRPDLIIAARPTMMLRPGDPGHPMRLAALEGLDSKPSCRSHLFTHTCTQIRWDFD